MIVLFVDVDFLLLLVFLHFDVDLCVDWCIDWLNLMITLRKILMMMMMRKRLGSIGGVIGVLI